MTQGSYLSSSTVSSRLLLRFLIIFRFLIALRLGRLRNFLNCWKKDFPRLSFASALSTFLLPSLRSRAFFAIFNASMLKRSCVSLWFTTRPDFVSSFRSSGGRGGGGGGPKIAVTFCCGFVESYLDLINSKDWHRFVSVPLVLIRVRGAGADDGDLRWGIKPEQKLNRRPRLEEAKWTWVTHGNRMELKERRFG